jgi:dCMP deaminase
MEGGSMKTNFHRLTKDEYFLTLAQLVAKRSNCYKRQVGCVLVDAQDNILSTGYNGVPRGIKHCKIGQCFKDTGEPFYTCHSIHAEQNALIICHAPRLIHKCYITYAPCNSCLAMLLNTGCDEIIYSEERKNEEKSKYGFELWKAQKRIISYSNLNVSNKI